eukprot:544093-Rhodomonas_salina.1
MTNGMLAKAFGRWASATEEKTHAMHLVARAVGRLQGDMTAAVFDEWKEIMLDMKLSKANEFWKQQADQEARERKLTTAIRRWKNYTLARALQAWRTAAERLLRLRTLGVRVVQRWKGTRLAGAFDRWLENAHEITRTRRVMRRTLERMLKRNLAKALDRWVAMAAELSHFRAVTRRVVFRWRTQVVAMSFRTWQETAAQRKVMQDVVQRILHVRLWKALNSWRIAWQEANREMAVIDKVLRRWCVQTLTKAMARWTTAIHSLMMQRLELDRFAWKQDRQRLYFAMQAWTARLRRTKHGRRIQRIAIDRIRGDGLVAAFEVMREKALRSKRVKQVVRRVVEVRARRATRNLSQAFGIWYHKHTLLINSLRLMARREELVKFHVLQSWSACRLKFSAVRSGLQRLMLGRNQLLLIEGFAAFEQTTVAMKLQQAVSDSARARVLSRMSNRNMAMALQKWSMEVDQSRRSRRIVANVLKRWNSRTISMAFREWQTTVSFLKETKRRLRKTMERMMHSKHATTFETWVSRVETGKRLKRVMSKIVDKWKIVQ